MKLLKPIFLLIFTCITPLSQLNSAQLTPWQTQCLKEALPFSNAYSLELMKPSLLSKLSSPARCQNFAQWLTAQSRAIERMQKSQPHHLPKLFLDRLKDTVAKIATLYACEKFGLQGSEFSTFVASCRSVAQEMREVAYTLNFPELSQKISRLAQESPQNFFQRYLPGTEIPKDAQPYFGHLAGMFSFGFMAPLNEDPSTLVPKIIIEFHPIGFNCAESRLEIFNTKNAHLYLWLYSGILCSPNAHNGNLSINLQNTDLSSCPSAFLSLCENRIESFNVNRAEASLHNRERDATIIPQPLPVSLENKPFANLTHQEITSTQRVKLPRCSHLCFAGYPVTLSDLPETINAEEAYGDIIRSTSNSHQLVIKDLVNPTDEELNAIIGQSGYAVTDLFFYNCTFNGLPSEMLSSHPQLENSLKFLTFFECTGLTDEVGNLQSTALEFPQLIELALVDCGITSIPQHIICADTLPVLERLNLRKNINLAGINLTGFEDHTIDPLDPSSDEPTPPEGSIFIFIEEDAGNSNDPDYQAGLMQEIQVTVNHY